MTSATNISTVLVPVMSIRDVWMVVCKGRVLMRVGVRLRDRSVVEVLVVSIVNVDVLMLERRVGMNVTVTGAHHEGDPRDHA